MPLSQRAVKWISAFLSSPQAKSYAALKSKEYNGISKRLISSQGLKVLKAFEVKAVGSHLSKTVSILPLQVSPNESVCQQLKERQPYAYESKQTWINYTEKIFALLDADLSLFNALESASALAIELHIQPTAQGKQNGNCSNSNEALNENLACSSNAQTATAHISTSSAPQTPVERPSIEYCNNVECIDIIKYRNGLPAPLLQEFHRISHWKGYPSELRYEQVKIKQEKQANAQAIQATAQANTPQTPAEICTVHSLSQMGFSDLQEIMSSMRNIQEQVQNQIIGNDILVEMIMMHIVHQREEKEEAMKMDVARMQSEKSMILQEEEAFGDNGVETVYNIDQILGAEGRTSLLFDKSFLLRSSQVKSVFRSLLHKAHADNGFVQKLLTIEKKCLQWYGTTTEPFFRYILCKRIESWFDDIGQHKVLMERLEKEIKTIEHDLYVVSDESDHQRAPRMFTSAQEIALSKGLISKEIVIE